MRDSIGRGAGGLRMCLRAGRVGVTLILLETDFNKNDEIRLSGFVCEKLGFGYFH